MNVKLLRKVAEHISEEPTRLYMHTYIQREKYSYEPLGFGSGKPQKFASCGTAACIAGWAVLLNHPQHRDCDIFDSTVSNKAQRLLRINNRQADALFAEWSWPDKFKTLYERAKTARGRASAAIRRIEHFIKTKGKE